MEISTTISYILNRWQKYCVFVIVLIVVSGIVFCNFSKLMDSELKSKWYYLYLIMSITMPILLMVEHKHKIIRHVGAFKYLLALLFLYFLIRIVSEQFLFSNIAFCLLLVLLYYLLSRMTFSQGFFYMSGSVIIASLLMSLYGISQYIGFVSSGYQFKIIGNFDNPVGYASMLSISLPFVCYYAFSDKRDTKFALWIIYILILIAIILSASRTGILTSVTISIIYAIKRYKCFISTISSWVKLTSALFVIALILGGLYMIKKDSAKGRVIIWRCTWEMIKEKPWFGHGHKSFEANYMLYQADYFERNQESNYILLSDNVKHPFNEFLLLIVEFGIFSFLLFFLFVIYLIMLYRKKQTDETFSLMLSLVAIAIFSFFSYPFQYPYTWFIFILCILSILFVDKKKHSRIPCLLKPLILMSSIFLFYITAKEMYYENKWYIVANKKKLGNMQEVMFTYETLYPHLKHNAYFLYNYAAKLNYFGHYEKSIFLVDKCRSCLNDYDVQMLMADNYFHLEKWNEAKKHYNKASYMCPNRFIPLNQLYKIAIIENDGRQAQKIALLIINKPIKIPSATIFKMKHKMQQYLDDEINCIK